MNSRIAAHCGSQLCIPPSAPSELRPRKTGVHDVGRHFHSFVSALCLKSGVVVLQKGNEASVISIEVPWAPRFCVFGRCIRSLLSKKTPQTTHVDTTKFGCLVRTFSSKLSLRTAPNEDESLGRVTDGNTWDIHKNKVANVCTHRGELPKLTSAAHDIRQYAETHRPHLPKRPHLRFRWSDDLGVS